jgi:hypothetical protein
MNKIRALLCLLVIVFSCSSCFQLIEEINVKESGSGDVTLTLNMSQSKTKLASIMLLDSVSGYKVPSKADIAKKMNEAVDYLKKSEGITNVKKTIDFDNYIATINFSFKEVSNLNNLTDNLFKMMKVKGVNKSSYTYNKEKNTFNRSYVYAAEAKSEYNKLNDDAKSVFKTATYTSIYRFDSEIQDYNNKLATVSKSKKAIMLKTQALDLINGKANLSNNIQLSK